MTEPTPLVDRRTGAAALIAGVLMFLSVASELVWQVEGPDGSVASMPGLVVYLVAFTVGAAALTIAAHGLGRVVTASRAGRVGRGLSIAGAVLLTAFAVLFLGTAVLTGTPLEASFGLFLLGFLLLIVGAVPFALGLRRSGAIGRWWIAVLVAGAGALVGILAESAVHEVGLFTFDAAWAALGLRILLVRDRDRRPLVHTA
jgi:hypothetical protein